MLVGMINLQNIKIIADELNIGIKSMVFVDDLVFEIKPIKSIFLKVYTLQNNREYM